MALRPIVLFPDPVLRRPASEVEAYDEDLALLVRDLADTMVAAPGVGLAAPQVGIGQRVAVVDIAPGTPESKLHVLVNPKLVDRSGRETGEEGCLSIPGLAEKVDRPQRIRLAAQDVTGKTFELEAEGFLARVLCHEIDHLDGVLFIDRLTGLRKELAMRRLRKLPFMTEGRA